MCLYFDPFVRPARAGGNVSVPMLSSGYSYSVKTLPQKEAKGRDRLIGPLDLRASPIVASVSKSDKIRFI